MKNNKHKESYVWTDDEVDLLLKVTREYKEFTHVLFTICFYCLSSGFRNSTVGYISYSGASTNGCNNKTKQK